LDWQDRKNAGDEPVRSFAHIKQYSGALAGILADFRQFETF
jgi:hypothetical protein